MIKSIYVFVFLSLVFLACSGKGGGSLTAPSPTGTGGEPEPSSPGTIDKFYAVSPIGDPNKEMRSSESARTLRPVLKVGNAPHSGTLNVTYNFEIREENGSFVSVGNVPEMPGSTEFRVPELKMDVIYTWRVKASAPNASSMTTDEYRFRSEQMGDKWSTNKWEKYFEQIKNQIGVNGRVTVSDLERLRPFIKIYGADFQTDSLGNLRERIFLPVYGCGRLPRDIGPHEMNCPQNGQKSPFDRTVDLIKDQLWYWQPQYLTTHEGERGLYTNDD